MTTLQLENQLITLKLELPEATAPGGNYQSVIQRGNIAYVAIQFPIKNGKFLYAGIFGDDLTTAEGYAAMQLCALNALAQVHAKVGIEKIAGLNHIDIYYRAFDGWDDSPVVANGASDLFVNVLGNEGKHTRAIVGVASLPRNFSVGLVSSFTLL